MASLDQSRLLVTEIPGPASLELNKRRAAAVSGGVGVTLPVFVVRAGGGIVEDADGNRLIDLGSGIAVTTIGNSAPRVVDAVRDQVEQFTHTCFMVIPYEHYVAVAEQLNRITPGSGEKRTVLFNSGAEAVENSIKVARAHTRKQAVVAFDYAYHGRTNLTMALTAKSMPYKSGFGPFAPEIYRAPVSYPTGTTCSTKTSPPTVSLPPNAPSTSSTSRSAPPTWPRSSSNRSRARAASSFRPTVSCPRCSGGPATTTWCSSPTRCRPDLPAPAPCSRATTRTSSPT